METLSLLDIGIFLFGIAAGLSIACGIIEYCKLKEIKKHEGREVIFYSVGFKIVENMTVVDFYKMERHLGSLYAERLRKTFDEYRNETILKNGEKSVIDQVQNILK